MRRCIFSPRAVRSLVKIHDYIAKDKPVAAWKFIQALEDRCRELAEVPMSGRALSGFDRSLRSIPFHSYIIVYEATADAIRIADIIHGRRLKAKAITPDPSPIK